jgi:hypothetical protein
VYKRGITDLDKHISELQEADLVVVNSFNKLISLNNQNSLSNKANISSCNKLIGDVVKFSNPAYRAVVNGTKPRRSPLHIYAKQCLSRQDLSAFWRRVGELSDDERSELSHAVARLVDRGG